MERNQVGRYLGELHAAEHELADAFMLVANRHNRESEITQTAALLASWSSRHVEALAPQIQAYGERMSDRAQRMRSVLFYGTRVGSLGLVQDLSDLAVLVSSVKMSWTILAQAASEARDANLQSLCLMAAVETKRQHAWLQTQIKHLAPQALTTGAEPASETAASLAKPPTVDAIPDPVWAPLSGGILTFVVGAIGLLAGKPFLLPSLGPTAYLQAETPTHPSARIYNTIVGHGVGLAMGFAMVLAFGVRHAPPVIGSGGVTADRVWAASIGVLLTILVALLLRASHPPAAATTLLVTLGLIRTGPQAWYLMVGAVIIALAGETLRLVRAGDLRLTADRRAFPGRIGRKQEATDIGQELGLPLRLGRGQRIPL
jgi:hypothetical protein